MSCEAGIVSPKLFKKEEMMKRTVVFMFAIAILLAIVGFVGFAPATMVAGDPMGCVACHTHIPWPSR